ncbi:hypothetical protein TrispH2_007302 [Trichoplax sp. H2]|nr:hypothetical protein TrispH2_007302 [Trichoplax sp. H2]|eukprot:RDD40697.1 hypothetical protein TrispH2_007302 [Trichoplax sp. H2]
MDFSVVGSLTKFSGRNDENVRTFTQMIECGVLALGLDTDKKQLAFLRLNLLDEVGNYYDDWFARETIRLETLAPARSTTPTSDDNPMETGEAYIARFQDIYQKAYPEDKLTNSQKLDYLLQGLETDTARMVRIQNPTNYREAVSLISRADDASSRIAGVKLREGRPPKKNPIATAGIEANLKHNNPKSNYNRNKYGNNKKFINNNNQRSASQSSQPPQFQCYNCHQWGHRVMECPQEKKFCSYCKRYGHLQTNCWKLLRQQQVIPRVGNIRPVAQTVSRTVSKPSPNQDNTKATINMIEQEAVRDNQEINSR